MPYIQYKEINFRSKSRAMIDIASQICDEYMAQGYTLTLRQLYYQFVARGHIENSQKEYTNLGNIIGDARLAGLLDWEAIEDRTRNLAELQYWDSPKNVLEAAAGSFRYDRWDNQPVRIEVWVEKEALAGVVERTAFKYRCPFFACRGYSSQSEAWRAGVRFKEYNDNGQPVKVIHLGDHDPSGIDMTRDNDTRLALFSEYSDVEVIRVALNEDQVRQYNPPPNPTKLTDTRAPDYVRKFGMESWELDALDPTVIDALISSEIEKYIDYDNWKEAKEREQKSRDKLKELAKNYEEEE
jgi:hypothetical protein